jgi:hypothetical protein
MKSMRERQVNEAYLRDVERKEYVMARAQGISPYEDLYLI